jgi:tetratricopeptide (TPR) repeat protein
LGNAYRAKRQYERALTHYQAALIQRQMIGYRRGEGEALTELATLHYEQGAYAMAVAYGKRASDIIETVQDVEIGQRVSVVLADVHRHLGDARLATKYARRAVGLARHMHNPEKEAKSLDSLGRNLMAEGYVDAAVPEFQQAAQIYRDLGQEHHAQRIIGLIGDLATQPALLPETRTDSLTPHPARRSASD